MKIVLKTSGLGRMFICVGLALIMSGCTGKPGDSSFRRGMRALEKGRHAESIAWFQRSMRLLSDENERALVFNGLGIAYYRLGHRENAVQAFESASKLNPYAMEPIYNLGIVFLETDSEDKAIAFLEKAALLGEQPGQGADNDQRALELLATVYNRRQQWDDARRVLNEAAQNSRRSPRILTALAVTELGAKNVDRSLELLQEALEQDARYAPAIYDLALINQKWLSRQDQALPLFAEYSRLVPSGPQAEQAQSMIKEIKQTRAPQPASRKPENQPPPPPPAPKASADAGKNVSPSTQAQTVVSGSVQPGSFPSFEELMQVANKLEDQGRREAAFNNYLRIARAAEQAGKTSVRNQAVRHAVLLAEGNSQSAYDLGLFFMEKNNKDEAVTYFKAAIDQKTNSYPSCMALAKLAIENTEYDTAIVSLKKADGLRADNPEALWLLADLYDRCLSISNSAASTYVRFAERFPKDSRSADALNRAKILSAGAELPPEKNALKKDGSSSMFQRLFKPRAGRQ